MSAQQQHQQTEAEGAAEHPQPQLQEQEQEQEQEEDLLAAYPLHGVRGIQTVVRLPAESVGKGEGSGGAVLRLPLLPPSEAVAVLRQYLLEVDASCAYTHYRLLPEEEPSPRMQLLQAQAEGAYEPGGGLKDSMELRECLSEAALERVAADTAAGEEGVVVELRVRMALCEYDQRAASRHVEHLQEVMSFVPVAFDLQGQPGADSTAADAMAVEDMDTDNNKQLQQQQQGGKSRRTRGSRRRKAKAKAKAKAGEVQEQEQQEQQQPQPQPQPEGGATVTADAEADTADAEASEVTPANNGADNAAPQEGTEEYAAEMTNKLLEQRRLAIEQLAQRAEAVKDDVPRVHTLPDGDLGQFYPLLAGETLVGTTPRLAQMTVRGVSSDEDQQPMYSADPQHAAPADQSGGMGPLSCLRAVSYSGWNPPLPHRQLIGDLFYVQIDTLDGGVLHVTATPRGFYVNRTLHNVFDPTPAPTPHFSPTLVQLLKAASPSFRTAWVERTKEARAKLGQSIYSPVVWDPQEVRTGEPPQQTLQWNVPPSHFQSTRNQTHDTARASRAMIDMFALQEPGNRRDWNEDYQTLRASMYDQSTDRASARRLLYRLSQEFEEAAKKGVVAILEGHLTPVNPTEQANAHVFFHNSIFFSHAWDTQESVRLVVGDAATRKVMKKEVNNLRTLTHQAFEGVHSVATCIVDYKGHRLVAQSFIPGILPQGGMQARLLQGTLNPLFPVLNKNETKELVDGLCNRFSIGERNVPLFVKRVRAGNAPSAGGELQDDQEQPAADGGPEEELREAIKGAFELASQTSPTLRVDDQDEVEWHYAHNHLYHGHSGGIEWKVVEGADKRLYMLDVHHITPRDANYVLTEGGTGKLTAVQRQRLDDDLTLAYNLRPELPMRFLRAKIDKERKQRELTKHEEREKSTSEEDTAKDKEGEKEEQSKEGEKDKGEEDEDAAWQREMVEQFNMNINVFYPGVVADVDPEVVQRDEQTVRDMSTFLWDDVLPTFIEELRRESVRMVDGQHMSELMHERGINMRYLGRLATLAAEEEAYDVHLHTESMQARRVPMPLFALEAFETEIVARCIKHIVNDTLYNNRAIASAPGPTMVSLLNALLGDRTSEFVDENEKAHGAGAGDSLANGGPLSSSHHSNNEMQYVAVGDGDAHGTGGAGSCSSLLPPCREFPPIYLWDRIRHEMHRRFAYSPRLWGNASTATAVGDENAVFAAARHARCHPLPLLRRICQVTGLRLVSRSFDFSVRQPFQLQDLYGFQPITTMAHPQPSLEALVLKEQSNNLLKARNLVAAHSMAARAQGFISGIAPQHPQVGVISQHMATILSMLGDREGAARSMYQAIGVFQRSAGMDSREVVYALFQLADVVSRERPDLSIRMMWLVIYLLTVMSGPRHPEIFAILNRLAAIYQDARNRPMACKCLQLALQNFEDVDRQAKATILFDLGLLLSQLGHMVEAVQHVRMSYHLFKTLHGENHTQTQEVFKILGQLNEAMIAQQRQSLAALDTANRINNSTNTAAANGNNSGNNNGGKNTTTTTNNNNNSGASAGNNNGNGATAQDAGNGEGATTGGRRSRKKKGKKGKKTGGGGSAAVANGHSAAPSAAGLNGHGSDNRGTTTTTTAA